MATILADRSKIHTALRVEAKAILRQIQEDAEGDAPVDSLYTGSHVRVTFRSEEDAVGALAFGYFLIDGHDYPVGANACRDGDVLEWTVK